jgi:hypothetical protein
MAQGPYQTVQLASAKQSTQGTQMSTLIRLELADTPAIGLQEELLSIQTRVPLPLPPGQPTLELAALFRARSLLDCK